jgi:predicted Rossmann-fold nucleotide-binding protein
VIERIVSGGQTGVDRAALDAAMEFGVPCGGWCPAGRLAEDGPIPSAYPLRETGSAAYAERTELNVMEADATLVLAWGRPSEGTLLTLELAESHGKPFCVVDLLEDAAPVEAIQRWLREEDVRVLNVAGPRASTSESVYPRARAFMRQLLEAESDSAAG